ncbi:DNA damage-regulated autophagy modulator protein 1 [Discoglossus pictus]
MDIWMINGMAFLPSILVIWTSAAFLVTYLISVFVGHVDPFVPYISDTGAKPPESGVFGFMLSVSAMLGASTMYTRYKLLEKQNELFRFMNASFNLTSLIIGWLGCLGMGIVANFQELTVPVVHDIGALITFVFGVAYIFLQSIITYFSSAHWNSKRLCHTRMAISVVAIIAVFPLIAFATQTGTTKIHWQPSDVGYIYHITSAICEWVVAFGFILFFITFIREFQGISMTITTEIHRDFR